MKKIILTILLFSAGLIDLKAQQVLNPSNDKLYAAAIGIYIDSVFAKKPVDSFYVKDNFEELCSLPGLIGDTKIIKVNNQSIKEKTKSKGIRVYILRPIQIEGETLYITISDYSAIYKNKMMNYIKGNDFTVFFRYNNSMKSWQIVQTKNLGY